MNLSERIREKKNQGYIDEIAEGIVGQEIIIEAISLSSMVDKVLLKGGIVMYNLTSNARRATRDLDFDLIRYDINNNSNIDLFISLLDKCSNDYQIKRVGEILTLHQEDYKGKRAYVEIKDNSYSFRIKLDIGIHTLLAIQQTKLEFKVLEKGRLVTLLANPIEQVIGEKLYSLAKHGILSTRYKDIFDVYYLIQTQQIDKKLLRKCLDLLIEYGKSNVKDIFDLCERIEETLADKFWFQRFTTSNQDWIDTKDYRELIEKVISFVYTI